MPVLDATPAIENTTRERVLRLVAATGPTTAPALADQLGLTRAGVRRHLGELLMDGLIAEHDVPRGASQARRGRPARHWVVTARGHAELPTGYAQIAAQAIGYLAAVGGPDAVEHFAQRRATQLEERYGPALQAAGDAPIERARALAEELTRDGYAASARPVGQAATLQLCQGNCPIQDVAAEFPQLCEAETAAFSRLLGVHVQRLSTIAGGGHVCTTNIPLIPTTSRTEGTKA
ncbi:MAG: winged helix-turn-helix transcriptional regulator [Actinomycetota bacterium]|nr:winged helix-turn-helix transcriptional regulator [Actinomycetota bacterium]